MVAVKTDKITGDALGTGRRKTAVARVRVRAGSGQVTINGRPLDQFFLVDGDRAEIAAVVHNTTAYPREVAIDIKATGLDLPAQTASTVTIPAGGTYKAVWPVAVTSGADEVKVLMSAKTVAAIPPLEDAVEVTLPVEGQALFFESIEEQEARRIRDDADAVRRLNRCLGLTLPDALAAMGASRLEQQAWRHADSGFAAQLSRHSRIRVTECGTFGDPGTQDYAWLAALPGETLRRIAGDPRQAELAMRNSPCWLGVERTSFVPTANFSQVTGFDNRDFLPPYFPFERGQDRVFGETVRFLFPGSVALAHPWAVLHQRVTGTGRAQALQQRWNPGGFPGFLTYAPLERAGASHAGDLPTRLAGLAAAFADLGHSPPAALLRLHAELQLRDQSQRLAGLRKSLELSGGASPEWADWLEQDLRKTRAATQREPAMPANSAEILALWQTAWRAFGRALAAWPAIRDAAGELGGERRPGGERPAWA